MARDVCLTPPYGLACCKAGDKMVFIRESMIRAKNMEASFDAQPGPGRQYIDEECVSLIGKWGGFYHRIYECL